MKKSLLAFALMALASASSLFAAVTVPDGVEIETYTGSATGTKVGAAEWDAQVAVDEANSTIYVKDMLPGYAETGKSQWIKGTLEDGIVTFKTYQNAGYQKVKNTTYTYCEIFGVNNKKMVAATFSWDASTKTLTSTNEAVRSYSEDYMNTIEDYTDLVLVGPTTPTAINDVKVEGAKTMKVIENGQLIIIKGNERYNIMGQKL